MPTYTLPDTQSGGSQTITANSMGEAQSQAQAAGTWSPAAGTYGSNSYEGGQAPASSYGGGGGGAPAPSGGGGGGGTGANVQAGQMLLQAAQQAAYQAYLNAKLNLDTDQNAWQKAAQEAATLIAQAGVTGSYQGMPTQAAIKQAADIASQQAQTMMSYANAFGVWGTPVQGQQTLAAQKQVMDQATQAAQLTGWYTPYTYTPPQAGPPGQGVGFSTVGAGMPGGPPGTGAATPGGAAAGQTGAGGGLQPGMFVKGVDQGTVGVIQPDGTIKGFSSPQEFQAAGGKADWSNITTIPQAQFDQGWRQQQSILPPPGPTAAQVSAAGTNMPTAADFAKQDAATQKQWTDAYGQGAAQAWAGAATQQVQQWYAQNPTATSWTLGGATGSLGGQAQAPQGQAQGETGGQGQLPTSTTTPPNQSAVLGAPPGWQQGQPIQTLAAQEQNYTQWLRSQEEARQQWTAQQTAAQNYLTMMTNLRGPADWAKYQQVLGATPQGTQDLVRAAAGQYIPGGGATTGVAPQAASLQSLYGQTTGGGASGQQQLQQMQGSLVAPNQMAPQTWNALSPSQQQMLLGVWESQGYSKDDAQNLFKQSLPGSQGQGMGAGSYRLQ